MKPDDNTILVTGGTGRQGGATAHHLLAGGWKVRALTRNPNSPQARKLAEAGAEVVQGNLNDRASVDRALQGIYGVFSVQDYWQTGYEGEIAQGKLLADAAVAAGVQHMVYTSVSGIDRNPGVVRHYDSKLEIEKYLKTLKLPSTVLGPPTFMENYLSPVLFIMVFAGLVTWDMEPDAPHQHISTEDIGAFARLAFENPERFVGERLDLAGDDLTGVEMAEIFSRVLKIPIQFSRIAGEKLKKVDPRVGEMFDARGYCNYRADIAACRALYPELLTFEAWLRKIGWDKL
ncbi:NmrA/HSCARG family protein [Scytonema sp. NUACC21]